MNLKIKWKWNEAYKEARVSFQSTLKVTRISGPSPENSNTRPLQNYEEYPMHPLPKIWMDKP